MIKTVALRQSEPKFRSSSIGTTQLFHNVIQAQILNSSSFMPPQNATDTGRIGDQIRIAKYDLKLVFGQKGDRPNVNFKWWIVKVPKGSSYAYASWFIATTNNVMLDDINTDFVKVLKSGYMRPNEAALTGTGDDEYTFCKRITFPYNRLVKFGPADAAVTHNDDDIYFMVTCYDAAGTVPTDNIAYVIANCTVHYRDP